MAGALIFSLRAESYFWQLKAKIIMVLKRLYTIYLSALFGLTFLLLFPAFFIFAQRKIWHKHAYWLTNAWGWFFVTIAGIKVDIFNKNDVEISKPCIYVANHFSYTDIATMPLIEKNACFVGKLSITKTPLFGYYFKSLHIAVDRQSIRQRAKVIEKNIEAIKEGKSLFMFPEGGITTKNPPYQAVYKDGAFRTAIKMKIPIVPVSLTNNWRMLPDDGKFLFRDNHIKIVIHTAIPTKDLTEENIAELRENTFEIIQSELINTNKAYLNDQNL